MDLYNQWLHHAQQPSISADSTPEEPIDLGELSIPDSQQPPPTPPSMTSNNNFFTSYPPTFLFPGYASLGFPNPWPGQQPSHVPVSSYSSLNGATSNGAGQLQQQLAPSTMIDPALLSGSVQSFFSQTLSPNASQGTLAPESLHAPSPPTSAGSSAPTPTPLTPSATPSIPSAPSEEKKRQFKNTIQSLLTSSAFTGAGAVNNLVGKILDFGIESVEPSVRLEILTKIRDHAGNHYFRAWSENENAMEMTKKWLAAGSAAAKDDPLKETIMPILHIIHRLPLTLEALKENKLGKMIKKLTKETHPAIKDMASVVEQKWRQLIGGGSTSNEAEERVAKKRKLSEPPTTKPPSSGSSSKPPASRKPAPLVKPAAAPAKKETKTVVSVNNAKSDSSFFSSNKPKLPSFKKAPPVPPPSVPQAKKEEQPLPQINAFAVALEGLKRRDSPSVALPSGGGGGSGTSTAAATPPIAGESMTIVASRTAIRASKKRKSVTWAPPDKLEMVKLIERAIYDDDPSEGHAMHNSLRELDKGEGAALHAQLFEELVDWTEPIEIELPEDVEPFERGSQSIEKGVQEERERSALTAVYMSAAHIPDTPAEPSTSTNNVGGEGTGNDGSVKIMICGPELDAVFHNNNSADDRMHVENALGTPNVGGPMVPPSIPTEIDHAKLAQMLSSLTPDLFSAVTSSAPVAPMLSAWGDSHGHTGHNVPPYGGQYGHAPAYSVPGPSGYRDGGGGGYQGRLRKVPCKFFLQGRCNKGDLCTFDHEFS